MFTSLKPYWMSLAFVILCHAVAGAHPWGGLAVDENGNVYFTFICPMADEDHYACVWMLGEQQELRQAMKSGYSPSDIILSRSPGRTIFGAERSGPDSNRRAQLWRLNQNGKESLIPSTNNPELFHIQAYAVSDEGTIYYARDDKLYMKKAGDDESSPVQLSGEFTRIDAMAWGPENHLYILIGTDCACLPRTVRSTPLQQD